MVWTHKPSYLFLTANLLAALSGCGDADDPERSADQPDQFVQGSYADIFDLDGLLGEATIVVVGSVAEPGRIEQDRYERDRGVPYTVSTLETSSVIRGSLENSEAELQVLQVGSTSTNLKDMILAPEQTYLLFLRPSIDDTHGEEWLIVGGDQGLYKYDSTATRFLAVGVDRPLDNPDALLVEDGRLIVVRSTVAGDRVCNDIKAVLDRTYPADGGTIVSDLRSIDLTGIINERVGDYDELRS
jgi:hypothetical protein